MNEMRGMGERSKRGGEVREGTGTERWMREEKEKGVREERKRSGTK